MFWKYPPFFLPGVKIGVVGVNGAGKSSLVENYGWIR